MYTYFTTCTLNSYLCGCTCGYVHRVCKLFLCVISNQARCLKRMFLLQLCFDLFIMVAIVLHVSTCTLYIHVIYSWQDLNWGAWHASILLAHDPLSPLAYPMITHIPPIASNLPIKTLVARQCCMDSFTIDQGSSQTYEVAQSILVNVVVNVSIVQYIHTMYMYSSRTQYEPP